MPISKFPNFERLHETHPALAPGLSLSMAEAARVALDAHDLSPPKDITVIAGANPEESYRANWSPSSAVERTSYANSDFATEFAAYGLAIAAVHVTFELYAQGRADRKTGADFWVDPIPTAPDYENSTRLEVSGTARGGASVRKSRLKQKVRQTQRGTVTGPAIAAVVGIEAFEVRLQNA